jgi:hypothetical protein
MNNIGLTAMISILAAGLTMANRFNRPALGEGRSHRSSFDRFGATDQTKPIRLLERYLLVWHLLSQWQFIVL